MSKAVAVGWMHVVTAAAMAGAAFGALSAPIVAATVAGCGCVLTGTLGMIAARPVVSSTPREASE